MVGRGGTVPAHRRCGFLRLEKNLLLCSGPFGQLGRSFVCRRPSVLSVASLVLSAASLVFVATSLVCPCASLVLSVASLVLSSRT
jgi:hypothetical protein